VADEARSQEPGVRSQEPGVRSQESEGSRVQGSGSALDLLLTPDSWLLTPGFFFSTQPLAFSLASVAYEFRVIRRVEFSDTDMAGIVHYSNFFRYMEAAEHAFFRSLGFSIVTKQVEPPVGWPRVHAECHYKKPLRFEDEIEIQMLVSEKKSKSLGYAFRIRKLNGTEPIEVARGALRVVCVTHQHGKMKAAAIPKVIADRIEVAPAELLE